MVHYIVNGGTVDPSTNLSQGLMFFRTNLLKLRMYKGSAWTNADVTEGTLIYDLDTKRFWGLHGTTWRKLSFDLL